MRINNNLLAMNTHRQLGMTNAASGRAMEKLSSGFRINRAGDDAAGLSISEKMRGQIRGLSQASRNAQDGISLIQTAEGAMNETHAILQRMRELAVQAGNDTNVLEDRTAIQAELEQLHEEVGRIATTTQFNTRALMNSVAAALTLHIGANKNETMEISFTDMRATAAQIGLTISPGGTLNVLAEGVAAVGTVAAVTAGAQIAIDAINTAITNVSTQRSTLGAVQNRLEHTIKNLDTGAENLQAAESRIRDVDMAQEMMNFTKQNILQQAATAMLAQANQAPQGVLQLLR